MIRKIFALAFVVLICFYATGATEECLGVPYLYSCSTAHTIDAFPDANYFNTARDYRDNKNSLVERNFIKQLGDKVLLTKEQYDNINLILNTFNKRDDGLALSVIVASDLKLKQNTSLVIHKDVDIWKKHGVISPYLKEKNSSLNMETILSHIKVADDELKSYGYTDRIIFFFSIADFYTDANPTALGVFKGYIARVIEMYGKTIEKYKPDILSSIKHDNLKQLNPPYGIESTVKEIISAVEKSVDNKKEPEAKCEPEYNFMAGVPDITKYVKEFSDLLSKQNGHRYSKSDYMIIDNPEIMNGKIGDGAGISAECIIPDKTFTTEILPDKLNLLAKDDNSAYRLYVVFHRVDFVFAPDISADFAKKVFEGSSLKGSDKNILVVVPYYYCVKGDEKKTSSIEEGKGYHNRYGSLKFMPGAWGGDIAMSEAFNAAFRNPSGWQQDFNDGFKLVPKLLTYFDYTFLWSGDVLFDGVKQSKAPMIGFEDLVVVKLSIDKRFDEITALRAKGMNCGMRACDDYYKEFPNAFINIIAKGRDYGVSIFTNLVQSTLDEEVARKYALYYAARRVKDAIEKTIPKLIAPIGTDGEPISNPNYIEISIPEISNSLFYGGKNPFADKEKDLFLKIIDVASLALIPTGLDVVADGFGAVYCFVNGDYDAADGYMLGVGLHFVGGKIIRGVIKLGGKTIATVKELAAGTKWLLQSPDGFKVIESTKAIRDYHFRTNGKWSQIFRMWANPQVFSRALKYSDNGNFVRTFDRGLTDADNIKAFNEKPELVDEYYKYYVKEGMDIPTFLKKAITLDSNDDIIEAYKLVKPKEGWTDVIVHGTTDNKIKLYTGNGNWETLSHRDFARYVYSKLAVNGKVPPIRLLSCWANGGANPLAPHFVNKLNTSVLTADVEIGIVKNGPRKGDVVSAGTNGKWEILEPGNKRVAVDEVLKVKASDEEIISLVKGNKPDVSDEAKAILILSQDNMARARHDKFVNGELRQSLPNKLSAAQESCVRHILNHAYRKINIALRGINGATMDPLLTAQKELLTEALPKLSKFDGDVYWGIGSNHSDAYRNLIRGGTVQFDWILYTEKSQAKGWTTISSSEGPVDVVFRAKTASGADPTGLWDEFNERVVFPPGTKFKIVGGPTDEVIKFPNGTTRTVKVFDVVDNVIAGRPWLSAGLKAILSDRSLRTLERYKGDSEFLEKLERALVSDKEMLDLINKQPSWIDEYYRHYKATKGELRPFIIARKAEIDDMSKLVERPLAATKFGFEVYKNGSLVGAIRINPNDGFVSCMVSVTKGTGENIKRLANGEDIFNYMYSRIQKKFDIKINGILADWGAPEFKDNIESFNALIVQNVSAANRKNLPELSFETFTGGMAKKRNFNNAFVAIPFLGEGKETIEEAYRFARNADGTFKYVNIFFTNQPNVDAIAKARNMILLDGNGKMIYTASKTLSEAEIEAMSSKISAFLGSKPHPYVQNMLEDALKKNDEDLIAKLVGANEVPRNKYIGASGKTYPDDRKCPEWMIDRDKNVWKTPYLETPSARQPYKVTVFNGELYVGNNKMANDGRTYTFALAPDGNIYASTNTTFTHASYLGGGNVAMAGEIRLTGREIQISNQSGHYKPFDFTVARVVEELAARGVDAKSVKVIIVPGSELGNAGSKVSTFLSSQELRHLHREVAEQQLQKYYPNLTPDEIVSLRYYSTSSVVNAHLANGRMNDFYKDFDAILNNTLEKHGVVHTGVTYSGLPAAKVTSINVSNWKVGDAISINTYTSSSRKPSTASDFMEESPIGRVMLVFKNPKGIDIQKASVIHEESEILLNRNSKFRVLKIEQELNYDGNMYHKITLGSESESLLQSAGTKVMRLGAAVDKKLEKLLENSDIADEYDAFLKGSWTQQYAKDLSPMQESVLRYFMIQGYNGRITDELREVVHEIFSKLPRYTGTVFYPAVGSRVPEHVVKAYTGKVSTTFNEFLISMKDERLTLKYLHDDGTSGHVLYRIKSRHGRDIKQLGDDIRSSVVFEEKNKFLIKSIKDEILQGPAGPMRVTVVDLEEIL
jgi:hypothetical protein